MIPKPLRHSNYGAKDRQPKTTDRSVGLQTLQHGRLPPFSGRAPSVAFDVSWGNEWRLESSQKKPPLEASETQKKLFKTLVFSILFRCFLVVLFFLSFFFSGTSVPCRRYQRLEVDNRWELAVKVLSSARGTQNLSKNAEESTWRMSVCSRLQGKKTTNNTEDFKKNGNELLTTLKVEVLR